jgi:hypothetical protein
MPQVELQQPCCGGYTCACQSSHSSAPASLNQLLYCTQNSSAKRPHEHQGHDEPHSGSDDSTAGKQREAGSDDDSTDHSTGHSDPRPLSTLKSLGLVVFVVVAGCAAVAASSWRRAITHPADGQAAAHIKHPDNGPPRHAASRRGTALISSPAAACPNHRLASSIAAVENFHLLQQLPMNAVEAEAAGGAHHLHGMAGAVLPGDAPINDDAPELAMVVYVAPSENAMALHVSPALQLYNARMQALVARYITAAMAALAAAEERELGAVRFELDRCWRERVGGLGILYALAAVFGDKPVARFDQEVVKLKNVLKHEQAYLRAHAPADIGRFIFSLRREVEAEIPDRYVALAVFTFTVDKAIAVLDEYTDGYLRSVRNSKWGSWFNCIEGHPMQLGGKRLHTCLRAELAPLRLFEPNHA